MTDEMLEWAFAIMPRYWTTYGALTLFVLAMSAVSDGVVPRQDIVRLAEDWGMNPGFFENGLLLLEGDGLIEAGLNRPRDAATMHIVGPIRLRLDRSFDR